VLKAERERRHSQDLPGLEITDQDYKTPRPCYYQGSGIDFELLDANQDSNTRSKVFCSATITNSTSVMLYHQCPFLSLYATHHSVSLWLEPCS
jgi:hypothetical protein